MVETSQPWDGILGGDATRAPYSAQEWLDMYADMFRSYANKGVIQSVTGELAVTGAVSPVSVAAGSSLVLGRWHRSSAVVQFAISTPGAGTTRTDRIVVRSDYVAYTVRLVRLTGAGGGAEPALTQTPGVRWEIPLAKVSIDDTGAITLTDEREYCAFHAGVTLDVNADTIMSLTAQVLGLDTQAANLGLFGPAAGPAAVPAFRAMAAADVATHSHTAAGQGGDYAWADITGFAIPSNTVKLAAVEGAATTVLRSDATLALDQSIAPTWTGAHIFKKTADSVTGWQVQDQDGNVILNVDSVNNRVGIGTSAPMYKLEVVTTDAVTASYAVVRFVHSSTDVPTTNFGMALLLSADSATVAERDQAIIKSYWSDAIDASRTSKLGFMTRYNAGALTEHMTIDGQGNVGIGVATPVSLVEVQGNLTTVGAVFTLGTKETSTVANDVLGRVNFYAPLDAAGGDANLLAASIVAIAEATFSATVNSTSLQFRTGASEIAITRMTVMSTGNVGLGTSSPLGPLHIFRSAAASAAQDILIASTIASWESDNARLQVQRGTNLGQGWNFICNLTDGTSFEAMRITEAGKVGIGTATIPHGAVGLALLALESAAGANGPHVQYTTTTDDYPLRQDLNYGHDNMFITFDGYYDGAWKSSFANSNFQIEKTSNLFKIKYDSGIAAGSAVPFHDGLILNTAGLVTIPGALTVTGTLTANGTLDANGIVTLGNGGATVAILSSDWAISVAGAMTGISGIANNGAYTQSGVSVNLFTGSLGLNIAAPQGKIHGVGENAVGYFIHFDAAGIDAAGVNLIPNGAGDVTGMISFLYSLKSTSATSNVKAGITTCGISAAAVMGTVDGDGNQWSMRVNADGSVDCYRSTTGGAAKTATISIWMVWL